MNHRRTISIAASRLIRNVFVDKCKYSTSAFSKGNVLHKAKKHKLRRKVLQLANHRLEKKGLPSIEQQISNNWWAEMVADYDGDPIPHGGWFVEIPTT
jgi:hypothetical protein